MAERFYLFETDALRLNAIPMNQDTQDADLVTDDPELIAVLVQLRELHQQLFEVHERAKALLRKAGNQFGY